MATLITPPLGSHLTLFLGRFRQYLTDRRFWAIQGLVLLVTGIHLAVDWSQAHHGDHPPELAIVVMYAAFFVPIVYASLNFGQEGAIPTALWTAVLAVPSIFWWHHGLNRVAEGAQHLTIIALAAIIARRVDR